MSGTFFHQTEKKVYQKRWRMLLWVDMGQELPFNWPLPKSMYNKKALTHQCKQSHAMGKPARELKGIWHTANTKFALSQIYCL